MWIGREQRATRAAHSVWPCSTIPDDTSKHKPAVCQPKLDRSGPSVRLAAQVVPWHTFNFFGFRPVDLQAGHSKYQGSRRQAESLGLLCGGIDSLGQAFTFPWVCHS
jgi:hypothetical protein